MTSDSPPELEPLGGKRLNRWRERAINVVPLSPEWVGSVKRSFTTRHVPNRAMRTLVIGTIRPRAGNLVLARVERIGHHTKLELPTGRRAVLNLGDEIIVAYANRYAPDQFEAHVPHDLGPCQLVASGGVAAEVISRSADVRRATDIVPLGLIGDSRGVPLTLSNFALDPAPPAEVRPPTVAVVGTSMNSGKTTTLYRLVLGLRAAGYRPGVTKVTGTGSGGDYWSMVDAGAHQVLDFTDAGLASTYRAGLSVAENTMIGLVDQLVVGGCNPVLMEVADGVFQYETAHLIGSSVFQERIDGVIFAASDAIGAKAGLEHLRSIGLNVIGLAGRMTRSPLATVEARRECDVPIFTLDDLSDPTIASSLFGLPLLSSAVPTPSVADPEEQRLTVDLRESVTSGFLRMQPKPGTS